jgi:cell division protein DivIC
MIKQLPESVKNLYLRIPAKLKNRYSLMFLIFFVWMLFFDKNDLITQWKLYSTELSLKKEKRNYGNEIKDIRSMREVLEQEKERFARERYFVHKPGEEVFVIVRE